MSHRLEEIELAVEEVVNGRIKFLLEFLGDPPPFTHKLTEEEQLQRYLNFQDRQKTIEAIATDPDAGPAEVKAYLDAMLAAAEQETENG